MEVTMIIDTFDVNNPPTAPPDPEPDPKIVDEVREIIARVTRIELTHATPHHQDEVPPPS